MRNVLFLRCLSVVISAIVGLVSITVQPARAELIPTDEVLNQASPARMRLVALLDREDVARELVSYGVGVDEAKLRLASLSDAEVSQFSRMLDTGPAAGDDLHTIIGATLFVFVLLLITDILGFTKIFPFTRSVR